MRIKIFSLLFILCFSGCISSQKLSKNVKRDIAFDSSLILPWSKAHKDKLTAKSPALYEFRKGNKTYGEPTTCERIQCNSKYLEFIGRWTGPFKSYSQELSTQDKTVFRPYNNVVSYSEKDCLRNTTNGDTFIIGRKSDTYPEFKGLEAKVTKGLLITGRKSDGTPFLRTIDDENGLNNYELVYQNNAASTSIWTLTIPAKGENPEMRFTTIDGQDFLVTTEHKRNVTVTMSIGPKESPYWEGVIAKGYHSLQK